MSRTTPRPVAEALETVYDEISAARSEIAGLKHLAGAQATQIADLRRRVEQTGQLTTTCFGLIDELKDRIALLEQEPEQACRHTKVVHAGAGSDQLICAGCGIRLVKPEDLTPIPEPVTAREQWGYLASGRFRSSDHRLAAKHQVQPDPDAGEVRTLAQLKAIDGQLVLCDGDGNPVQVAQ